MPEGEDDGNVPKNTDGDAGKGKEDNDKLIDKEKNNDKNKEDIEDPDTVKYTTICGTCCCGGPGGCCRVRSYPVCCCRMTMCGIITLICSILMLILFILI